jgi:hypothetical protein
VVTAFAVAGLLSGVFFGPSCAVTQALAPPRMRATAASILIFVKTMIGLGLGPLMIGRFSDLLSSTSGAHSLRHAMMLLALFGVWSAVHFMLGARPLRADLDATAAFAAAPQLRAVDDPRGKFEVATL